MNNNNTLSAILCTNCSESGEIFNNTCKDCQGSGYIAKDNDGNEYYLKKEGDNLIVTGAKNQEQKSEEYSSNKQEVPPDSKDLNSNDDNGIFKLIGNISFGIILLPLILITLLYFQNNYILYAIIVLVACFWGFFNIIYLPENIVSIFKKDYVSTEVPKDLHWAIQEIKKYTNAS